MIDQPGRAPDEADAAQLVTRLLSAQPIQVTRFRTGLAHYVYDVTTRDQDHLSKHLGGAWAAWSIPSAITGRSATRLQSRSRLRLSSEKGMQTDERGSSGSPSECDAYI